MTNSDEEERKRKWEQFCMKYPDLVFSMLKDNYQKGFEAYTQDPQNDQKIPEADEFKQLLQQEEARVKELFGDQRDQEKDPILPAQSGSTWTEQNTIERFNPHEDAGSKENQTAPDPRTDETSLKPEIYQDEFSPRRITEHYRGPQLDHLNEEPIGKEILPPGDDKDQGRGPAPVISQAEEDEPSLKDRAGSGENSLKVDREPPDEKDPDDPPGKEILPPDDQDTNRDPNTDKSRSQDKTRTGPLR